MPTEWWLRPDSTAARVGEHRAVWNRVNFRPFAASCSATEVWHGPPNALRRAEADVVDEDHQHVRGARKRTCSIGG